MTAWTFIGLDAAGKPIPGASERNYDPAGGISQSHCEKSVDFARLHARRLLKRWKAARVSFFTDPKAPYTECREEP